jgi:hypothetical protein
MNVLLTGRHKKPSKKLLFLLKNFHILWERLLFLWKRLLKRSNITNYWNAKFRAYIFIYLHKEDETPKKGAFQSILKTPLKRGQKMKRKRPPEIKKKVIKIHPIRRQQETVKRVIKKAA